MFHRKRITNFAMHLQIPAFSRKMCRRVQTELYKSPQIPAFSRKAVPRFAGIYKFPHFPAKSPAGPLPQNSALMYLSLASTQSSEYPGIHMHLCLLDHSWPLCSCHAWSGVARTGNLLFQVAVPSSGAEVFRPRSGLVPAFVFQHKFN